MSSTTLSSAVTTPQEEDGLSQTEWIVIIVVLVIVLIVLIIAIAKCLEFKKPAPTKSLIQNDEQSMRSGTVRSNGSRSMASTRPKSVRKLPLNAEITRFSAGRVSRSAEYGVVIKDIKKTVQEPETMSHQMAAPPVYQEQVNTLQTYREDSMPRQQEPLSSPPNGNLILNSASHSLAPANSKAVFVAPDELYSTPRSQQPVVAVANPLVVQAPATMMVDRRLPLLRQPTLIMQ